MIRNVLFAFAVLAMTMLAPRTHAEPTLQATSRAGSYHVLLMPAAQPVPLRRLHRWQIHVRDPAGRPLVPRQLVLDGGMPGHSHGLAIKPVVTQHLGEGRFVVEGVSFHMAGAWLLRVGVGGADGWDTVDFEFQLTPDGQVQGAASVPPESSAGDWTAQEKTLLKTLTLGSLGEPPPSPSNRMSDNPEAAALGKQLFFSPSLSSTGAVACATCHEPGRFFTDGRVLSKGLAPMSRHAPGLLGVAYRPWLYWDGRKDSLWSQALGPLEAAAEMGGTRVGVTHALARNPVLSEPYTRLFGPLPPLEDLPA
ncbi:MAG: cytochrome-c peroxidase [Pseudomonadota bacterium]